MKKCINMLLFAVTLLAAQACTKSGKDDKIAVAAVSPPAADAAKAAAERRATFEKKRLSLEEKRKAALEERLKSSVTYKDSEGNLVYNKAEEDPSFNGGDTAMKEFLHDNVKFPKDAASEGLEGTVFIDFVVTSNGNVRDVTVMNISDEKVDQRFIDEAVRVVKSMPRWLPGRQHGTAVNVSFSIPISFQLES
jgi:TonB family protein